MTAEQLIKETDFDTLDSLDLLDLVLDCETLSHKQVPDNKKAAITREFLQEFFRDADI